MIINEVDYKIMCAILNKQKNNKKFFLNGSSVKEIQDQSEVSLNRIYTGLRSLMNAGYIEYGLKKGRTNTYNLTNEGIKLILETGKEEENLDEYSVCAKKILEELDKGKNNYRILEKKEMKDKNALLEALEKKRIKDNMNL